MTVTILLHLQDTCLDLKCSISNPDYATKQFALNYMKQLIFDIAAFGYKQAAF